MGIRLYIAGYMMALGLIITGGGAFAFSSGGGKSQDAPGQQRAIVNCSRVITEQEPVRGGNGARDATDAPTNCDHMWTNR